MWLYAFYRPIICKIIPLDLEGRFVFFIMVIAADSINDNLTHTITCYTTREKKLLVFETKEAAYREVEEIEEILATGKANDRMLLSLDEIPLKGKDVLLSDLTGLFLALELVKRYPISQI